MNKKLSNKKSMKRFFC